MPAPSSILYRRLLRYTLPHLHYFILSVVGFALFAGTEALMAMTLEFFINTLEGKTTDKFEFIPEAIRASIFFVPAAAITLSLVRGVAGYLGNFYMSRLGLSVVNDLRKTIFSHMMTLPQHFYDQRNSGELVSLIIYNIEQVTGSVTNALKILFRDGFTLIAFLGLLIYLNWKLTLIFLITAPVLAGLIFIASNYFRKVSRHIQSTVGHVTHVATESFQGIKLVKSYRGERYENARFKHAADENLRFGIKFSRVDAIQTPVLHIIITLALALIFLLVALFWEGTAAEAVVYVTVAGIITKPFRQLTSIVSLIQKGLAAAETIFSTLDTPAEIDDGNQELAQVAGHIAFDHVSFSYDNNMPALSDVCFNIKPGETLALVGPSGSGKTTIANLLLRFYNASSGHITIDGTPLKDLTLANLRSHVALVNQQTVLFNDSIRANIAYGIAPEKIDEDRMQAAAKNAYADDFIKNLEHGYDTPVGESGARLSGGQRQRLAIARALYRDAPLLILDEATSALDNESEKQIQLALEKLKKNRTTIVIAHRLSTIENADNIAVLDKGKLVEIGKHEELMARNAVYANLHTSQFSEK